MKWFYCSVILVGVGFCIALAGAEEAKKQSSKTPAQLAAASHSGFVPKGYTITFRDEFSGKTLDTQKWSHRSPNRKWGACILRPDCAVLNGKGSLLLKVRQPKIGDDTPLDCGMVTTHKKFSQKYGYYEARIKFQQPQGCHGAFWIQSPTIGKYLDDPGKSGVEIDVIEYFGDGRWDGGLSHNLHWGPYNSKTHKKHISQKVSKVLKFKKPASAEFHTYAVLWTPTEYVFSVDGKETFRVDKTKAAISHRDQHVILSLLSSAWERKRINPKLLPNQMTIDYVRVYKKNK